MTQTPDTISTSPNNFGSYPDDYQWSIVTLRCDHGRFGVSLVDWEGVPRFFRVRCRASRCQSDGEVTFHIVSLFTGERFGPFREAYRDPRGLPLSLTEEI